MPDPVEEIKDDKEIFDTDVGNGKRLAYLYGTDIAYSYNQKAWYIWNGKRWKLDNSGEIYKKAKATVRSIYKEGLAADNDIDRVRLIKHALASESRKSINAMVEMAQSELHIAVTPDRFDKDPMLFNVMNGTIDLQTGKLREYRRDDYITKISPVEYDQTAKCPTWLSFLDKIFAGNKNLIEYLQRKTGYILTGDTSEEDFDELYGTGGNGKSKFTGAIIYVMGEYHIKTNVETIQAVRYKNSGSAPTPDIAALKGARLVTVSEPEMGTQLNEQRVKDWTGRDPITARHLHAAPFTFIPEFKLWIYTNYEIRIKGQDNAIWRRVKLVPFEVTIPENEIDKKLDKKLKAEASGILNWMIEGCLKWQKDGLKVPEEIIQATAEYREEQDTLREFFNDCCILGENHETKFNWIFLTYKAWCRSRDIPSLSQKGFIETLKSRKIKKSGHKESGNFYRGLKLADGLTLKCEQIESGMGDPEADGLTELTHFVGFFSRTRALEKNLTETVRTFSPSAEKATDSEITENEPSGYPSATVRTFSSESCGICGLPLGGEENEKGKLGQGLVHKKCKRKLIINNKLIEMLSWYPDNEPTDYDSLASELKEHSWKQGEIISHDEARMKVINFFREYKTNKGS